MTMRTLLPALMVLVCTVWADQPARVDPRPPYQRLLEGEDAKAAAALLKRITDLEEGDGYAEAVKAAEELMVLRTRVQGTDHQEVRDTRLRVTTLRLVAGLAPEDRKEVRAAVAANQVGIKLYAQGKYAEAQPLLEKALAIRRKALGEEHPQTATGYGNVAYKRRGPGQGPAGVEGGVPGGGPQGQPEGGQAVCPSEILGRLCPHRRPQLKESCQAGNRNRRWGRLPSRATGLASVSSDQG
jgi:tetratricopeptide (TPR) repeat protein